LVTLINTSNFSWAGGIAYTFSGCCVKHGHTTVSCMLRATCGSTSPVLVGHLMNSPCGSHFMVFRQLFLQCFPNSWRHVSMSELCIDVKFEEQVDKYFFQKLFAALFSPTRVLHHGTRGF
jgi:hypothetical protein